MLAENKQHTCQYKVFAKCVFMYIFWGGRCRRDDPHDYILLCHGRDLRNEWMQRGIDLITSSDMIGYQVKSNVVSDLRSHLRFSSQAETVSSDVTQLDWLPEHTSWLQEPHQSLISLLNEKKSHLFIWLFILLPNNSQVVSVFVEVVLWRVDDLQVSVRVDCSDLLHNELAGHVLGSGWPWWASLFPIWAHLLLMLNRELVQLGHFLQRTHWVTTLVLRRENKMEQHSVWK